MMRNILTLCAGALAAIPFARAGVELDVTSKGENPLNRAAALPSNTP